ncbi:A24 family peptidase [Methanosarcina barkeri]|uniref:A24 family peptidase n=1 Tax=Methanosarcina barkeri TaxID=2208 RepID=UPI000A526949|nr:A24 family peptidase [Methanosarcina barkeri]
MPLLLSGVLVFTAVYLLFQFGAFGGGDAKGLIVLSILFPSYPVFSFSEKNISSARGSTDRTFHFYGTGKCPPDDNTCSPRDVRL